MTTWEYPMKTKKLGRGQWKARDLILRDPEKIENRSIFVLSQSIKIIRSNEIKIKHERSKPKPLNPYEPLIYFVCRYRSDHKTHRMCKLLRDKETCNSVENDPHAILIMKKEKRKENKKIVNLF